MCQVLRNLFSSDNVLFSRICRFSVYNSDTTLNENIRYFMYKYNISYNHWYSYLSNIYVKKIHMYAVLLITKIFVLRERSGNCVKVAIVVSHNSLTLPNFIV